MKIVIAPDSFKESMTALEAAIAIEKGFSKIFPEAEYIKVPMADGGEGTVQSLVDATNGRLIEKSVTGPLGEPVKAVFGLLGDEKTAIIEMAEAAGLHLVRPNERNPLHSTTFGVGELILAAIDYGADHIIIGLGGSSTNDGGAGMAQALGANLLDKEGREIGFGGGALSALNRIDLTNLHPGLAKVKFTAACDVDNPLTGPNGASAIFGPQKGATEEMVAELDANLHHFAEIIKRDVNASVNGISGAGAAGGLGGGMIAFLSAELKSGIQIVIEESKLRDVLCHADLVITGEGKIDGQTVRGKTPIGVSKVAKESGIPVVAIAGTIGKDSGKVHDFGIDALFSIVPGAVTIEDAMENAKVYTEQLAEQIARLFKKNFSKNETL